MRFSVGKISPPPSLTIHHIERMYLHLHKPMVKTLLSPSVDNSVLPELTSISFSPLIKILTGPEEGVWILHQEA